MPHVKLGEANQYLNLYYELYGTGEIKVIFIMGLWTEGNAWFRQTEFFAQNPSYQCVSYDNRGCGQSSSPLTFHYSTSQMAKDALALIDHLQWKQCHVVGISMGGMISMELALLAPERILSLNLLATHAGGFVARAPFIGIRQLLRSLTLRDEDSLIKNAMEMLYGPKTLANPEKHQKFYDYYQERFRKRLPPSLIGLIGQVTGVQRHFVNYADLLRIRYASFPCLIFVGTEDHLVREANSYLIQRTLGCRLIKLHDAGHGLQGECADEINRDLHEFFQSIDRHEKVKKNETPRDYQREIQALEQCCQHRTHCLVHDLIGLFKSLFFGVIFYGLAGLIGLKMIKFESILILACLSSIRRCLSCIIRAFRARQYVRQHNLQLVRAGIGIASPEEPKNGIPAGCGFDYPIPSLILLVNLFALIYWIHF